MSRFSRLAEQKIRNSTALRKQQQQQQKKKKKKKKKKKRGRYETGLRERPINSGNRGVGPFREKKKKRL